MRNELDDDPEILQKLGGDPRVQELFDIAFVAYKYLPDGMFNFRTGKPTRDGIIKAVEAFGFRAARIPWERFPKRFHKNKPELQLFKPELTDAEIEQYWVDLIAAQPPDPEKRRRKPAVEQATRTLRRAGR